MSCGCHLFLFQIYFQVKWKEMFFLTNVMNYVILKIFRFLWTCTTWNCTTWSLSLSYKSKNTPSWGALQRSSFFLCVFACWWHHITVLVTPQISSGGMSCLNVFFINKQSRIILDKIIIIKYFHYDNRAWYCINLSHWCRSALLNLLLLKACSN